MHFSGSGVKVVKIKDRDQSGNCVKMYGPKCAFRLFKLQVFYNLKLCIKYKLIDHIVNNI